MLDFIQSFDRDVLYKINQDWTAAWADWFFPLLTDFNKSFSFQWLVVPIVIATVLFHYRLKSPWIFLGLAMLLLLTDWSMSHLVRDHIDRFRPFMTQVGVLVKAPVFGDRSFPSIHAANSMGLAIFFGAFFPPAAFFLILAALLVGYSRIYCGVHWPTDVLAGFFFGWLGAQISLSLIPIHVFRDDSIPFVSRMRPRRQTRLKARR